MRILILAGLALIASACAPQPVYRTSDLPFQVQRLELDRYLGLWHEQARLPNRFERGCARATAEYSRRDDGLISVLNTCYAPNGDTRDARARARWAGEEGEGKLKVSFFGPFWADYWVVARAEDYSWSIVSEPKGRYLWVLTRAERISEQERTAFEARLRDLGFNPAELIWVS